MAPGSRRVKKSGKKKASRTVPTEANMAKVNKETTPKLTRSGRREKRDKASSKRAEDTGRKRKSSQASDNKTKKTRRVEREETQMQKQAEAHRVQHEEASMGSDDDDDRDDEDVEVMEQGQGCDSGLEPEDGGAGGDDDDDSDAEGGDDDDDEEQGLQSLGNDENRAPENGGSGAHVGNPPPLEVEERRNSETTHTTLTDRTPVNESAHSSGVGNGAEEGGANSSDESEKAVGRLMNWEARQLTQHWSEWVFKRLKFCNEMTFMKDPLEIMEKSTRDLNFDTPKKQKEMRTAIIKYWKTRIGRMRDYYVNCVKDAVMDKMRTLLLRWSCYSLTVW